MTTQFGDPRLPQRFWTKVAPSPAGCWEWAAVLDGSGYGKFRCRAKMMMAHRVSYAVLRGEIQEGLQLDHLCRNRKCVNPDHLEPVTPAENARRGERAMKTHCHQGHEFSPENTYVRPEHDWSRRQCRECSRAAGRRYLARKRGATS